MPSDGPQPEGTLVTPRQPRKAPTRAAERPAYDLADAHLLPTPEPLQLVNPEGSPVADPRLPMPDTETLSLIHI